jgi:hypothetical protein
MRSTRLAIIGAILFALAGCDNGNLKSAADYNPPPPPPVLHPDYNPYAAYGDAEAIWQPPVADRGGTIAKPEEPATDFDRPDYEGAPWATGAKPSPFGGPPGTF